MWRNVNYVTTMVIYNFWRHFFDFFVLHKIFHIDAPRKHKFQPKKNNLKIDSSLKKYY